MNRSTTVLNPLRSLLGATLLAAALAAAFTPGVTLAQDAEPPPASVNINTADREALAAGLQGIGASRADAIIRYREMYGPFESVDELVEVSGVGAATLERNRDRITLD